MVCIRRRYFLELLISVHDAKNYFDKGQNVLFADCRFSLQDPQEGERLFNEEHVPGAAYFDLEKDLSGKVEDTGGRHPLPNIESFVQKIEKVGINNDTTIIAYDDQRSAMASRFLWLMKYIGHQKVYIMDGGLVAWKQNHYPVTTSVEQIEMGKFQYNLHKELIATQHEVADKIKDPNVAILDSRAFERYAGWEEPIDHKAGHVPSAQNYFWKDLFEGDYWKSTDALKAHFSNLEKFKEIIVYCGSGVTATPNVIALWEAGFQNVKLYVGSWSDWITNPNNEIASVSK